MSITFNDICILLEEVEKVSIRHPQLADKDAKALINNKTAKWFSDNRLALDNPETSGSAVLSAIFPHRRKDRVYGLQAPLLSAKIIKLLNFNHGQRALFDQWFTGINGDLGKCTQRAIQPWDGTFKKRQVFPIERVDALLTQLAAKYRYSDPAIQQRRDWDISTDTELRYILGRLQSWEAKWLVRLILREYPTIELDEIYVFGQYHFLLPDLLKFQGDFDVAFDMLRGGLSCYPPQPRVSQRKSMRAQASNRLTAIVGVKVGRPTFHKAWSFKHCFQLVGNRAWAAEVKYDGEYCEVHVDLGNAPDDIKIFSKNGKDATVDRAMLHSTIRAALRVGQSDCMFKRRCLVLGEMVLYSDKEKKILPFSKIRKHIRRSGSFIGTLHDSLPHEWEHLMLVFFDVLMLDDEPVMRKCLQERRHILRDLVTVIPGRSQRSEWTLLDFKAESGVTDLKQAFARTIAYRQEGLILKPLHASYFPLLSEIGSQQPGYFVKMKKDYLSDMEGERDLGDFAIIGARFDPQVAPKANLKPLHWTHFYLGCVSNMSAIRLSNAKPRYKVVGCLGFDKCIPKLELKYLNIHGRLTEAKIQMNGSTDNFSIDHGCGYTHRMSVAFKQPFVAEILGGGYEKVQNETFEMLRHPRVKKIHHDRTWEDTVTMNDLEQMAAEQWGLLDADKLDGHARDVALLVTKYTKELGESQADVSEYETTQETSQHTASCTSQESAKQPPEDAEVQETQYASIESTHTTTSTSHCSGSTQGAGIRASREVQILVREDTSERLAAMVQSIVGPASLSTPPGTAAGQLVSSTNKRSFAGDIVSPSSNKRRRQLRTPLKNAKGNRNLGTFDYDSQERTIHIYAEEGWKIQVHSGQGQEK